MKNFTIYSFDQLVSETDVCLDMLVAFDCKLDIGPSLTADCEVVRVLSMSCNDYITFDDVYIHNESRIQFMTYERFVERFAEALDLPYNGQFEKLYNQSGEVFAIAIGQVA